jgi:uncharacterized protein with ParB-like and HNH nuclease domain
MSNTLEHFFTGKFFRIPNYQRDYAWEVENIDDLIDDIIESIETSTNHYIGTFILARTADRQVYNVVDGQQRLTSLTMLLSVAIRELADNTQKIISKDKFINSDSRWKLQLLNDNSIYLQNIFEGKNPEPETKSQDLIKRAYEQIEQRVKALKSNTIGDHFLDSIKQLEVMEFIESDDGKAIRIFQTVNDRGKPLSNIDKAKSLLIYYSNRFLSGKLDDFINNKFGEIFHYFNEIKTIGDENKIDIIRQRRFSEDSVMRYHFLSYAEDKYDYKATEDYVLNIYLKTTLKNIKSDQAKLGSFIEDYVGDLNSFFKSFLSIIRKVPDDKKYYQLFSILGLSAFLYPLAIRLETCGFLEKQVIQSSLAFIDLIEIADLRVYKIRGTDPARDISYLARDSKKLPESEIKERLVGFIKLFMSDTEFSRRLNVEIYPNVGLTHILIEYDQSLINKKYTISELKEFNRLVPTVEHIFPREARFDFPNYGFSSEEEYIGKINQIGNLTILEKSLNSQCSEKNPDQKINDNLYGKSKFEGPKQISAEIKNRGTSFIESDISIRGKAVMDFCLKRWSIK